MDAYQTQLLEFHPHAREVPGGMRFVLEFDGIRVGVYVCPMETASFAILADVGLAGTLDPTELLEWNGFLAREALAIINQTIVVRAVVDASLPFAEIERRIQETARIGAQIKSGNRRTFQPSLFAHYSQ